MNLLENTDDATKKMLNNKPVMKRPRVQLIRLESLERNTNTALHVDPRNTMWTPIREEGNLSTGFRAIPSEIL